MPLAPEVDVDVKALRWVLGTGAAIASVLVVAGCGGSSSKTTRSAAKSVPPATELVLAQSDMPRGWTVSNRVSTQTELEPICNPASKTATPAKDHACAEFSHGGSAPATLQGLQVFDTAAKAARQFEFDSKAVPIELKTATGSGTAVEPVPFPTYCDQQTASTMNRPDKSASASSFICRIGTVEFDMTRVEASPVDVKQFEQIAATAAQKVKTKTS